MSSFSVPVYKHFFSSWIFSCHFSDRKEEDGEKGVAETNGGTTGSGGGGSILLVTYILDCIKVFQYKGKNISVFCGT